jgi:hypothetical protein
MGDDWNPISGRVSITNNKYQSKISIALERNNDKYLPTTKGALD